MERREKAVEVVSSTGQHLFQFWVWISFSVLVPGSLEPNLFLHKAYFYFFGMSYIPSGAWNTMVLPPHSVFGMPIVLSAKLELPWYCSLKFLGQVVIGVTHFQLGRNVGQRQYTTWPKGFTKIGVYELNTELVFMNWILWITDIYYVLIPLKYLKTWMLPGIGEYCLV